MTLCIIILAAGIAAAFSMHTDNPTGPDTAAVAA